METNHKVSKVASEAFWRISNEYFHKLYVAKGDNPKKVCQFQNLRNKLYQSTPRVNMDIGYKSKVTGETTVLHDVDVIPASRFPPDSYKRLYEIASVKVSKVNILTFNLIGSYQFVLLKIE